MDMRGGLAVWTFAVLCSFLLLIEKHVYKNYF
jgi:hypothetical protein